jgi:hypothetical protein
LQHGRDVPVGISNQDLPDFYMADYSVWGLLVDDLDNAYQVLKNKDFSVCQKPGHLEVNIQGANQMSEMVNLLTQKGIGCAIADIIDQVYQG